LIEKLKLRRGIAGVKEGSPMQLRRSHGQACFDCVSGRGGLRRKDGRLLCMNDVKRFDVSGPFSIFNEFTR
jgi:hypothetical protein